jgi:osomolarity two-component system sensor histidine kinase NIK1
MIDDPTLESAAGIIASLAAGGSHKSPAAAAAFVSRVRLPGPDTPAKKRLELEIQELACRIGHLENKTRGAPESPLSPPLNKTPNGDAIAAPVVCPQLGTEVITPETPREPVTDYFKHHGDDAVVAVMRQVHTVDNVVNNNKRKTLHEQQQQLETTPRLDSVTSLKYELYRHQKANEAFHTALREIGEIITAVARGDLTMKVRMDSVELDPEITTFKNTINTMIDQLQTFASEVSRVAREVGTEGLLGGQAHISGVAGTWKELTDNGAWIHVFDCHHCWMQCYPVSLTELIFGVLVNVMAQNLTDQGKPAFPSPS